MKHINALSAFFVSLHRAPRSPAGLLQKHVMLLLCLVLVIGLAVDSLPLCPPSHARSACFPPSSA